MTVQCAHALITTWEILSQDATPNVSVIPNAHHEWHALTTDVSTHVLELVVKELCVMSSKDVPDAPVHNSTKATHRADAILSAQPMTTAHHTKPAISSNVSTLVREHAVWGLSARLRITNPSASAPKDTLVIHLSHADHSLKRTCAVITLAVMALIVPQVLTVKATIVQCVLALVGSLATPLSPVREENANDTTTAEITRLAMLTLARIPVTLTLAQYVVIMLNVLLRIINPSALAHLVMMGTHYSHVAQG